MVVVNRAEMAIRAILVQRAKVAINLATAEVAVAMMVNLPAGKTLFFERRPSLSSRDSSDGRRRRDAALFTNDLVLREFAPIGTTANLTACGGCVEPVIRRPLRNNISRN